MSTISNVQEAREALCNGELFQVGGRFINPRDIVEVDPNDGTNPIFRLEDGRTVQHNRFTPGDVGDYLAAALDYAQRGGQQSEAIKPAFNRFFVGGGATPAKIYDEKGAELQTVSESSGPVQAADFNAGFAFRVNGSQIDRINLESGAVTTFGVQGSVNFLKYMAVDEVNQRLFVIVDEGADNQLESMDYDGGNNSVVVGTTSKSMRRISVSGEISTLVVSEGSSSDLTARNLDGSNSRTITSAAGIAQTINPDDGEIITYQTGGGTVEFYDPSGNLLRTGSTSVPSVREVEYNGKEFLVSDNANDDIYREALDLSTSDVLVSTDGGEFLNAGLNTTAL